MSERDLRGWTIDWDGSPMKDGEPPRDGLSCKDLRDACDEIDSLRSQLATAQATYLQFCKKHDEKMEKAIKALTTAKTMISDQLIWNAIVDLETNKTLGEVVDSALKQIELMHS